MAGYFGLVGHDFHGNRNGFLACRKYTTRDPKEGMLRIFYARKKSDGFGRVSTRDLGYQRPAC
jgi:hypothetical protein